MGNYRQLREFDPRSMKLSDEYIRMIDGQITKHLLHESDFAFLSRYDPGSAIMVDVGSNIGNSALSANNACPGIRIFGFEPNHILKIYLDNVSSLLSNYSYKLVGLSNSSGSFKLYIPVVDNFLIVGESSLDIEHFSLDTVSQRLIGYSRSGHFDLTVIQCEIETLDDQKELFEASTSARACLVKVDVEGSELSVLEGGVNFIRKFKPTLLIEEGHRPEICEFLFRFGYKRYLWNDPLATVELADHHESLNSFFIPD